ncbi:MAG: hypothetical protein IKX24_07070 [Prevotella sp.]|nr:hypothetical protein [Prevotella sp.]MBR5061889.1 hypothetical protein [Prevotella sp.]
MRILLRNSSITGNSSVEGIVGKVERYSDIENCYVENTVCLMDGSDNAAFFGGIAGIARGVNRTNRFMGTNV